MAPLTGEESLDREMTAIPLEEETVRIKLEVDFTMMRDTAFFYYRSAETGGAWIKVGADHKLYFKLDHFTGCRFGLVVYSTEEAGGCAGFCDFVYRSR